jgi:glycosyltransferase involved in cell wall biosynthesis
VAVAAAAWQRAFGALGWSSTTVAGEGPVDVVVPGLGIDDAEPPDAAALDAALAGADLVVVENLLTIPMRLPASRVAAAVLRGRPTVLHHHDPPWQRARYAHVTELPVDDPAWRHVAINDLTRDQLRSRGLAATTIYPGFEPDPPAGDRAATRAALGVGDGDVLLLHPVRAIERKDVPRALALAEAVGGTYWLTGPAEEGYGPELDRLLASTTAPVRHVPMASAADGYAACDAVVFPSTWEGFGQPPVEAATHRRPAVVGRYPVAEELRAKFGFAWLDPADVAGLRVALRGEGLGSPEALARNHALVRAHLSPEALALALAALLRGAGWGP